MDKHERQNKNDYLEYRVNKLYLMINHIWNHILLFLTGICFTISSTLFILSSNHTLLNLLKYMLIGVIVFYVLFLMAFILQIEADYNSPSDL